MMQPTKKKRQKKQIAARGEDYDGKWKDGKQHGKGTYTFANGDCYTGEFVGGKQHGQGTYIFASGQYYKGGWKDDHMHGQGKLFADGKLTEGNWEKGTYAGEGQAPLLEAKAVTNPPSSPPTDHNPPAKEAKYANQSNLPHTANFAQPRSTKLKKKPSLLRKLSSGIRTSFGGKSPSPQDEKPRHLAALKFLEQMDTAPMDEEDTESKELHHFWNLLLRGLEVKVPFSGGKAGDGVINVFYLDGHSLYLKKEKVLFSEMNAVSRTAAKRGAICIPLSELRDVGYGGVDKSGKHDEEDEDDLNAAPCLNRYVKLIADNKNMELEVTQRAAELMVGKFKLVVKAIDMFEKIETAMQKAGEVA